MKIVVFATVCFLAVFIVAATWIILTGAIDHHFGYFGSIIKTIPSSAVSALVATIAFWLTSLFSRGQRTRRSHALAGGLAGAISYIVAGVLSEQLQDIHLLAILLPFVAGGILSAVLSKPRHG